MGLQILVGVVPEILDPPGDIERHSALGYPLWRKLHTEPDQHRVDVGAGEAFGARGKSDGRSRCSLGAMSKVDLHEHEVRTRLPVGLPPCVHCRTSPVRTISAVNPTCLVLSRQVRSGTFR